VKEPFIWSECGSQKYVYVPCASVIVQFAVPVPATVVDSFTPGPLR
jgi:hypothetical protein